MTITFTNLGDLVRRERDLDKIALIDLGGETAPREFSYRQLDGMANGVARATESVAALVTQAAVIPSAPP